MLEGYTLCHTFFDFFEWNSFWYFSQKIQRVLDSSRRTGSFFCHRHVAFFELKQFSIIIIKNKAQTVVLLVRQWRFFDHDNNIVSFIGLHDVDSFQFWFIGTLSFEELKTFDSKILIRPRLCSISLQSLETPQSILSQEATLVPKPNSNLDWTTKFLENRYSC